MLSEQAYGVIWRAPWLLREPERPGRSFEPAVPLASAERRWLDCFARRVPQAAAAAPPMTEGGWTARRKAGWLNIGSTKLVAAARRAAGARMESAAWSKRCNSASGS